MGDANMQLWEYWNRPGVTFGDCVPPSSGCFQIRVAFKLSSDCYISEITVMHANQANQQVGQVGRLHYHALCCNSSQDTCLLFSSFPVLLLHLKLAASHITDDTSLKHPGITASATIANSFGPPRQQPREPTQPPTEHRKHQGHRTPPLPITC